MLHSQRFTRDERVKRAGEIKHLFKDGCRVSVAGAKLFYLPNNLPYNRIGFPLPRGFGNAVQRNHSKRLSRESYRSLKAHLNIGFDMLLLVYPASEKPSFHSRCAQFRTLCEKAGLINEQDSKPTA
ncbi:MAG: ribonuclease P protein component [Treponemataceae bacterium]|nr:ribonuclease P protein component [Treponemataceae bacterium]